MKKIVLLLATTFLLVACTKPVPQPIDPLSPDVVKERLEQVAEDIMDEYPANDFEKFFDLSSKFVEKYFSEDYDWEDFYEYYEEKEDDFYSFTDDEWYENGVNYGKYTEDYLIRLSDIRGKLNLGNSSATCSDYDGLKVLFTLEGNNYEADVTFSGRKTTAYYSYKDVWGRNDSYYDYYYRNEDIYNIEVEVPEKVTVQITENGKSFADVTVDFVVSFSKSGVNLTKDCFLVTTTVKIDEHELVLSKAGYNASVAKATAGCTLRKGSKVILTMAVSGDVKVNLVTEEVNPEKESGNYDDYIYPEFTMAKNAEVNIDILGKVQIKGSCSNILTLIDHIETLWDTNSNSSAERAIDNMNNILDLGLYFDGASEKQADIVMDYYVEDGYNGEEVYDFEPIMEFGDGSKYAFYEYFDEDAFDGTLDLFDVWIEMYEGMFDHYFDY